MRVLTFEYPLYPYRRQVANGTSTTKSFIFNWVRGATPLCPPPDSVKSVHHLSRPPAEPHSGGAEREIFIDNLLVRVHFIIEMSRPALRHGSLNPLFQVALYLPS